MSGNEASGSYHFGVYRLMTTADLHTGNKRTRRSHLDSFETGEEAEDYRERKAEEIERLSGGRARLSIKELDGPLPERYRGTGSDRGSVGDEL